MTAEDAIRTLSALGATVYDRKGFFNVDASTCLDRRPGDMLQIIRAVHTLGMATERNELEILQSPKDIKQIGWRRVLPKPPEKTWWELRKEMETPLQRITHADPKAVGDLFRLREKIGRERAAVRRHEVEYD